MEIKEKYRSYGSSSHAESPSFKATLLTIAAIAAIGLLVFVADDASVTFTRKFAKDITIP